MRGGARRVRGGVLSAPSVGRASARHDARARDVQVRGPAGTERVPGDAHGGGGAAVEKETGGGGALRETKSDGRGAGETEHDEAGGGRTETRARVDVVKVEKGWGRRVGERER